MTSSWLWFSHALATVSPFWLASLLTQSQMVQDAKALPVFDQPKKTLVTHSECRLQIQRSL